MSLRVASVVTALSRALDLSTGQPMGHSMRTCLLGMRIGNEIGLRASTLNSLFYALLLKDCGCSGNASKMFHALGSDDLKAKRDAKLTDWTRTSLETFHYALSHVSPGKPFLERAKALFRLAANQKVHAKTVTAIRCERGSALALLMGLSADTAAGIMNLDEHWDGNGNPERLAGADISLLSRIMLLAQTLEVYLSDGHETSLRIAKERTKTWFDPDLVSAAKSLAKRGCLFEDLSGQGLAERCLRMEPEQKEMVPGDQTLDRICMAFANVVDAKSPYTFNHSVGVANAAVAMARAMGLPRERMLFIRHAALVHDLGKLGISNSVLEKPTKLDEKEWNEVKQHPRLTWELLREIPGFEELSEVAGAHHEKLDGSGYFRGVQGENISLEARMLAVADVFDALTAKRPYRDGLPIEQVFQILNNEAPHALDGTCIEALKQSGAEADQTYMDLEALSRHVGQPTVAPGLLQRSQS